MHGKKKKKKKHNSHMQEKPVQELNISRQRISERDMFTFEEKEDIAAKSDHKCCHCGKKCFYGYGATVDHFVPLAKGGSNRDINLVMLCEDCNSAKGEKIIDPYLWLPHLKDEHHEKLMGYFESYVKSFEFIDRTCILACDEYGLMLMSKEQKKVAYKAEVKKGRKLPMAAMNCYSLKRGTFYDQDRLADYLGRCLKKTGHGDSLGNPRLLIEFWLKFGCIYFCEKVGEISMMATATVTPMGHTWYPGMPENVLSLSIFPLYSNERAYSLAKGLSQKLPMFVLEEQGMLQIPVRLNMLEGDKLVDYVIGQNATHHRQEGDHFFHELIMVCATENESVPLPKPDEDEDMKKFFSLFGNVMGAAKKWMKANNDGNMEWLLDEI